MRAEIDLAPRTLVVASSPPRHKTLADHAVLAHQRPAFPPCTCGLRGGVAAVATLIGEEETERLLPLLRCAITLDESTPTHVPLRCASRGNDP